MSNKKELINEYKNRKQIGGVCKITNVTTNKIFIFTAADIDASKNRFEFCKKTGSCVNMVLAHDWKKYGSDSFTYEVIEELEKSSTQTSKEFNEELNELLKICIEKSSESNCY